jgi:hypothetical protein
MGLGGNMSIEEIIKLDGKLGEHYILIPTPYDGWRLFKTDSNREIMNSDNNTKEQLLQFIKEHKKYNMTKAISTTCLVINALWLLLIIANFFIKSTVLRCMSWGVLVTLVPVMIVLDVVMNNNEKVINRVVDEDYEYHKRLEETKIAEEINKKIKKDAKKVSKTKGKTYIIKTKDMHLSTGKIKNTTVTKAKVKNSTSTTSRKPRTKVEEKKEV